MSDSHVVRDGLLSPETFAVFPGFVSPRLRRLAFVQGWSDELLAHALQAHHNREGGDDALPALEKAAEDLGLAELRDGGDDTLRERGARALGFGSHFDLKEFCREKPVLSERYAALSATSLKAGTDIEVVAVSSTEIIVRPAEAGVLTDGAFYALERARIPESEDSGAQPLQVGSRFRVESVGLMSIRLSWVGESVESSRAADVPPRPPGCA